MDQVVLSSAPLASQWPTVDPFLFCVHHLDRYPAANRYNGPDAPLDGRALGRDFEGIDGWRMYHGLVVPGFPQHPHRGFETITYVRRGVVDHADSLGAAGRYGRGDVQWMTAGAGIVHAEMFPLLDEQAPNTTELFQIWLNLPAADKLVDPHFSMLWGHEIPRLTTVDEAGRATEVTVVAGAMGPAVPPPPPPSSWAARPDAEVTVWHLRLEAGASHLLEPAGSADVNRTLYVFEGDTVDIGDTTVGRGTGVAVVADVAVPLRAGETEVEILVLGGRPIGEPVAQYGPFVMNDRAGIDQAIRDYQRTGYGGWPWAHSDPVHREEPGRFAVHADGRTERMPAST